MSIGASCGPVDCKEHNSDADADKYKTGACTYEIWNSISSLHVVSYLWATLIPQ